MFLWFENLVDPYVGDQTRVPSANKRRYLVETGRAYRWVLLAAVVTSILVAVSEILMVNVLGQIIDKLGNVSPVDVFKAHGVFIVVVLLLIAFARPALFFVNAALLNNALLSSFQTHARWGAHRHVLGQSVGWFERDFAGRIANRVMQGPTSAGDVVFQVFDAMVFAVAFLFGTSLLLSSLHVYLMLPFLAWLVVYGALTHWSVVRVLAASEKSSAARSAATGAIVDAYTNVQTVKLFAHDARELAYSKGPIEDVRHTMSMEMRLYSIMDFGVSLLNGFLIAGVMLLAIYLWSVGAITLGETAVASAIVIRLNSMMTWIIFALSDFFRALGVVSESLDSIAQPRALMDAPDAAPLKVSQGGVVFKGLTHHYGRGSGGLAGLDLTLKPGEKVGVIGRSGAGKSTLVKLLLRFYEAEAGVIEIDGQSTSGVTQDSLRAHIGMVTQESALMHRTIRENILYGAPDATEADMITAAKRAHAHDFIMDLAGEDGTSGYDVMVGERGVKLSGGQRQRIALARVILKDAPILVLDEATSALDSEVEAAIQDTLADLMRGKTVIAIAHRLSTIAHMDRIVVIDAGKVAESGTHAELLAKGGLYAGFWARQSGGFLGQE